jgi:hypothetical protein
MTAAVDRVKRDHTIGGLALGRCLDARAALEPLEWRGDI